MLWIYYVFCTYGKEYFFFLFSCYFWGEQGKNFWLFFRTWPEEVTAAAV